MNFIMKMIAILVGPVALAAGGTNINNLPTETASERFPQAYFVEEYQPDNSLDETYSGTSSQKDLYEALAEIGAKPYPEDRLVPFFSKDFAFGSLVKLYRAPSYFVIDGKKQTTYRSWSPTVGGLLREKKISLGQDDKINFASDFPIEDGMTIKITRVAHTQVVEKEDIDYKVIKKDDPNLDKGRTSVKQAGIKGQRALTYAVTREDGVEIAKVLIKNEVLSEPTDEILMVGTKPVITVRCKYNDTVIAAALKYKQDPNAICNLMMKESNGNNTSVNPNGYYGLFQYDLGLWASASAKAGYAGAGWDNATAQIYTTCYLFSVGQSWRW